MLHACPNHLAVTHLQGVLAMSWSGHDAGLLLSSAKDNRTILWDVVTGETLGELSAGNNWDFDVLWSPSNPGVFATSSYGAGEGNSGKVSLSPAAPFCAFQQFMMPFDFAHRYMSRWLLLVSSCRHL